MPTASVVGDQLNFTADEGAVRSLAFTLLDSSNNPINLTGIVLEFVAEAIDGTKTVSILTTDVSNPMGSLVIGSPATNGQVTLNLTATATSTMYPARGGYLLWSLWYQPGGGSAQSVVNGQVTIRRVAQP